MQTSYYKYLICKYFLAKSFSTLENPLTCKIYRQYWKERILTDILIYIWIYLIDRHTVSQGLNISQLLYIFCPNHVLILTIKARLEPNWNLTFFNGSINNEILGRQKVEGDIETQYFKQICKWIPDTIDLNCVSPSVSLYTHTSEV